MKKTRIFCLLFTALMCVFASATLVYAEAGGVEISSATFPDNSFRAYVIKNIDKDGDGFLSAAEASSVTSIGIGGNSVSSLDGIGYFPNLTELKCAENKLTSLDLSGNTALTSLNCERNCLTYLDVSVCAALQYLDCSHNELMTLDVTHNPALKRLSFYGNRLTTIDLSENTALTTLSCGSNELTALDLSGNTALQYLGCGDNNLTELNLSGNTELWFLSCAGNKLTSLDLSNNGKLTSVTADDNVYKVTEPEPDEPRTFSDTAGHWAEDYIEFVAARRLFLGTGPNTFSPDKNMSRAMIWVVLARMDGIDTSVESGVWYDKGLAWAKAYGVSDGTNPNGDITREQLVTMLWRAAGNPKAYVPVLNSFRDADSVSSYAVEAMSWAVNSGIISGVGDSTLLPGGTATRAQLATIITRYIKNEEQ